MKSAYQNDRRGPHKGPKKFVSHGDRPMLHDAVCAKCGNECQVPFRPSGSRPVLCLNCFKRDDVGAAPQRFGDKRPYSKPSFGNKGPSDNLGMRLSAIERKLDAILEALSGDDEKLF